MDYLMYSSIALLVFWVAYKVILENTSWHAYKRFYLIGALAVSLSIPLITVQTEMIMVEPVQEMATVHFAPRLTSDAEQEAPSIPQSNPIIEYRDMLWFSYLIGVAFFLSRFGYNLFGFRLKRKDQIIKYHGYDVVLRDQKISPHSFWNRIFISRKDYEKQGFPKAILDHEKSHLDQKHSLDTIIVELIISAFWFNPLLYLYRDSVRSNHEFLADRHVLSSYDKSTYQQVLMRFAQKSSHHSIAHSISRFKHLKKRLLIMKKQTTLTQGLIRQTILIPIIAVTLWSCGEKKTEIKIADASLSQTEQQQISNEESVTNSQTMTQKAKGQQERIYAEPGEKITPEIYHKYTSFKRYKTGYQYIDTVIGEDLIYNKKYTDFTEEERSGIRGSMMNYVPRPTQPQQPTQKELDEFLNDTVFRVWIDGREIENKELKDYKPSDFKHYSGRMFVHQTGRKTHPQAFNVMFYSTGHFEKSNMGKQRKFYGDYDMTSFENYVKVGGYYNRTVDESLNLPQQILSHAVLRTNGKTKVLLKGEPFTYREVLTKLADAPYAKVELKNKNGLPVINVIIDETLNKNQLSQILEASKQIEKM